MVNIDGTNAVLGRLATSVVKQLLKGEQVNIVNIEKIIITGDPKFTVKKYIERRQRGSAHHGPFFPKTPEGIVKRAIRGMMPYKTAKGRAAMKKLRIFVSMPENIKDCKAFSESLDIKSKYMTVEKLSKTLGWKE